ncbi:hypothetical protein L7F22_066821 [Adiantum nelumboides]|nr:hypothetical protein [Adiantum nelumboides]
MSISSEDEFEEHEEDEEEMLQRALQEQAHRDLQYTRPGNHPPPIVSRAAAGPPSRNPPPAPPSRRPPPPRPSIPQPQADPDEESDVELLSISSEDDEPSERRSSALRAAKIDPDLDLDDDGEEPDCWKRVDENELARMVREMRETKLSAVNLRRAPTYKRKTSIISEGYPRGDDFIDPLGLGVVDIRSLTLVKENASSVKDEVAEAGKTPSSKDPTFRGWMATRKRVPLQRIDNLSLLHSAHEIDESSGQAEEALQVVTAVTMFKQLMENPRRSEQLTVEGLRASKEQIAQDQEGKLMKASDLSVRIQKVTKEEGTCLPSSTSIPDVQGNTNQEKGKRQLLKGWESLNNRQVLILYDHGSTYNFISLDIADKLGTPVTSGSAFEGLTTNCTPVQEKLNLRIGMYKGGESFLKAPIEGCDVILEKIMYHSEKFDPKLFLSHIHQNTGHADLEAGEQSLKMDLQQRKQQLKLLVKENFDCFVSCKNTIDDIHMKLQQIEADTEGAGTVHLSSSINEVNVIANRAFGPLFERQIQAERIRSVQGMLQRFRTLFNLPSTIRGYITKGEYELAVREYKKAKSLVLPTHVRVLKRVLEEVEKVISEFKDKLFNCMEDSNVEFTQLESTIRLLLELEPSSDPVWHYLTIQDVRIRNLLEGCSIEHEERMEELQKQSWEKAQLDARWKRIQQESNKTSDVNFTSLFGEQKKDSTDGNVKQAIAEQSDVLLSRLIRRLSVVLMQQVPPFWRLSVAIFNGKFAKVSQGGFSNVSGQQDSAVNGADATFKGHSFNEVVEMVTNISTLYESKVDVNPFHPESKLCFINLLDPPNYTNSLAVCFHLSSRVCHGPQHFFYFFSGIITLICCPRAYAGTGVIDGDYNVFKRGRKRKHLTVRSDFKYLQNDLKSMYHCLQSWFLVLNAFLALSESDIFGPHMRNAVVEVSKVCLALENKDAAPPDAVQVLFALKLQIGRHFILRLCSFIQTTSARIESEEEWVPVSTIERASSEFAISALPLHFQHVMTSRMDEIKEMFQRLKSEPFEVLDLSAQVHQIEESVKSTFFNCFFSLREVLDKLSQAVSQQCQELESKALNGGDGLKEEHFTGLQAGVEVRNPPQQLLMVLSNAGYCKTTLIPDLLQRYQNIWVGKGYDDSGFSMMEKLMAAFASLEESILGQYTRTKATLIGTAAAAFFLEDGLQWGAAPAVKGIRDAAVELLHPLVAVHAELNAGAKPYLDKALPILIEGLIDALSDVFNENKSKALRVVDINGFSQLALELDYLEAVLRSHITATAEATFSSLRSQLKEKALETIKEAETLGHRRSTTRGGIEDGLAPDERLQSLSVSLEELNAIEQQVCDQYLQLELKRTRLIIVCFANAFSVQEPENASQSTARFSSGRSTNMGNSTFNHRAPLSPGSGVARHRRFQSTSSLSDNSDSGRPSAIYPSQSPLSQSGYASSDVGSETRGSVASERRVRVQGDITRHSRRAVFGAGDDNFQ